MVLQKQSGSNGSRPSGKPVHRSFDAQKHVHCGELKNHTGTHLIVGVETGLHAAVVVATMTRRLNVYDAAYGDAPAGIFAQDTVLPLLKRRYPRMLSSGQFTLVVTPPDQRDCDTEASAAARMYNALREFRGHVEYASNNSMQGRLGASERFLSDLMPASPFETGCSLTICPVNASPLIDALSGGYHYPVDADGNQTSDDPANSHPDSDLAAAFHYACLKADNGQTFGRTGDTLARPVQRRNPLGWS